MRTILLTLAAIALPAAPCRADEPKLGIGDKAPKLDVKEFVKGEAVTELAKGKVHVLEFFATWCGTCRATIPHLNELQKKHGDVIFIGVSVFEHDAGNVKPFVAETGRRMEYRVAVDAVPEGKEANQGAMARNWMDAAGVEGIPSAIIVNGDGVVAWIGHPKELDKPLAEIVAGEYDLKAAASAYKAEKARAQKLRTLTSKIRMLQSAGDAKGVLEALDTAIQEDAKLEKAVGSLKFQALAELGDVEKALSYGRKLIDDMYKDNAQQLNRVAWPLTDPDNEKKFDPKLVTFAVEVAKIACDLTKHQDGAILDTLACAYFRDGKIALAIETQEKAIKFQPDSDDLKAHLETFKKALKKDKDGE